MGSGALLRDVRILDLTGPDAQLCTRIVAELGAEVILVEPAEGVPTRRLAPFRDGHDGDNEASLAFAALNSGKRSVVIVRERARDEIRALARTCDAVVLSHESAWRSDVDVAQLRDSGTPVVVLTPFGETGPYAGFKAPEIVTTALGGLLYFSGDVDKPPCTPPESLGQYFASTWGALAVVSAVWARRQRGLVARYDVTTQEALATLEHLVRAAAMDGVPIKRNGSQHKNVAPARVFRSRDGFVYIYVSQAHWKIFLKAWQPHPAEFDDAAWVPNAVRRKRADELNAAIEAWTAERSTAELVRRFQAAGVPCLAVNRPSQFLADDQVRARELRSSVSHPALGTFMQLRSPALVDGERAEPNVPPRLGEHTAEVLGGIRSAATP
jgi:crotonobetainyl-CoA:carnitine CoA-transferase CaiB-like acyl-CoA transferase